MLSVVLLILLTGIPVAAFCSLVAGVKTFRHDKLLAGFIIAAAIASAMTFLWEMRYDIDVMRALLGYRGMEMIAGLDPDRYFLALYIALFLAVLTARFRWRPEYGSAIALNLSLTFWLLAGIPYLVLSPGMFAP